RTPSNAPKYLFNLFMINLLKVPGGECLRVIKQPMCQARQSSLFLPNGLTNMKIIWLREDR
ncbi:MAG TPA: hypothetical protein VNE59_07695, partial [Burkholderiales bacterium]|nr:hypothetical protein [Burkholderiales bacterium]